MSAATTTSTAARSRSILGSILLNVLALGGLVCIVLVVLAFIFKITIVMFATGSMAPGIPTGSIAFVREIPASDIAVGDVVTVERPAELPVTHRVVEILGTDGDQATFHMKGDANAEADPVDYTAQKVRLVLWSIPGVAPIIVWFQNPFLLGAITLGAAVLVTWAFWPREPVPAPAGHAPPDGSRRAQRHGAD
jgi:signal peptidase I